MRHITRDGITGYQYESIQEAWDTHYTTMHGDNPISGELYHQTYQAFLSGIISGINLASVKYGDYAGPEVPIRDAIAKAFLETLEEAMTEVRLEFVNKKGKQ